MAHFSDGLHLELCNGMNCHTMKDRSEMYQIPGKRSWWCERCWKIKFPEISKNPGQTRLF